MTYKRPSPGFQENSHIPTGSLPCCTRRQQDGRQTSQKGSTFHCKESSLQVDTLKKHLNCNIAMKYKQEADKLAATKKWRDIHKIWAEYKGKPMKEAVANIRLKTNHDCLGAHLRKIGIYESTECAICQMPNSTMEEKRLLYCPKLDTDQQVLKNSIKLYWDARVMMR